MKYACWCVDVSRLTRSKNEGVRRANQESSHCLNTTSSRKSLFSPLLSKLVRFPSYSSELVRIPTGTRWLIQNGKLMSSTRRWFTRVKGKQLEWWGMPVCWHMRAVTAPKPEWQGKEVVPQDLKRAVQLPPRGGRELGGNYPDLDPLLPSYLLLNPKGSQEQGSSWIQIKRL